MYKQSLTHKHHIYMICMLFWIPLGAIASNFCENKTHQLTTVEQKICSSPSLIWSDSELNALYRLSITLAPDNASRIKEEQKLWLLSVRNKCDDPQCLAKAYLSRNNELIRYVNSLAQTIPDHSEWKMTVNNRNNDNDCEDYLVVDFARTKTKKMAGMWEGSTFCGAHINHGMIDVNEIGKLFDVRILGGQGPSYYSGVDFLVRKNNKLYVANLFDRSSTGMTGDYESFDNGALVGGQTYHPHASNEYKDITDEELSNAWNDTEKSAIQNKICPPNQSIIVCIRRVLP